MATVNAKRVVLASGNPGKLKEFRQLLASCGLDVLPQSDFNTPDVEETGLSFVENAILKARAACAHTGLPAIADDSGLAVDALGGAPGIYSARYAALDGGGNSDDDANNAKLMRELADLPDGQRGARFICLLVYMRHAQDPTPIICQGSWEGRILHSPCGDNGFGYDPLFFVPEKNCSSAQLPKEVKNQISHRGRAMRQLLEKLQATTFK